MLEPPKIKDSQIIATLHTHYDLDVVALNFLPLGHDAFTWVYHVESNDGQISFLKLRAVEGFNPTSLLVPSYLQGQKVPHIVAPLPATDQSLWFNMGGFILSLYPWINSGEEASEGMSDHQWRNFGALAKKIHTCRLPPELLKIMPRERFIPSRYEVIADLQLAIDKPVPANASEEEFADFWRQLSDKIAVLVDRTEKLGRDLRQRSDPSTLCHADMHVWNLMIDDDSQLWLMDWDEVTLSLKERDLMFVIGGIGGDGIDPRVTKQFMAGYGETIIDYQALTYYRYAWALQDIAANGERVLFTPELNDSSRRAALKDFKSLFKPGNIVELALATTG